MNDSADRMLLLSNFRETISVLESLRASSRPGRGLGQIPTRPVFSDGLRASEVPLVTEGRPGEFPVLLVVDRSGVGWLDETQRRCVPLSAVTAVVFRSDGERERFLDKRFENTSLEGLELTVLPGVFNLLGGPRFTILDERPRSPETDAWRQPMPSGASRPPLPASPRTRAAQPHFVASWKARRTCPSRCP